ncbi:MAG: type II toxin-antitoxin system HipA family toxin [Flavobacteriales bacterium]
MSLPEIKYCPGSLSEGFNTYSRNVLNRMFFGRKVHHVLPYYSPTFDLDEDELFDENRRHISISGVQEKFSLVLEKNKLRLAAEGEIGGYILKPIPASGKRRDQMPGNEHLTMQIARQIFGIETAENAMIFFRNGAQAYITKRFDIAENGSKWAQDDFASLAGRTPQTHGEHYKYLGNYADLFQLMNVHLTTYKVDAPKLLARLIFNFLFSNGDAHLKNFSIVETAMGDYRLSPAYDLLNSRIHIADKDFALEDGLIPTNLSQGKISSQFAVLAKQSKISDGVFQNTMEALLSKSNEVEKMITNSFLNDSTKRNYWQAYQGRLKQLMKK